MTSEFEFIDRLRMRLPSATDDQVWIGDDAAVLENGQLFATDVLVEGVHFDLAWCDAAAVGWKALAVNVSDIAAMGGSPTAAVVSVVVPPGGGPLADDLGAGLAEASEVFGCALVGGDTSTGPALVVSVAILGTSPAAGAVLRSGARAGDAVFVTGTLGSPAAALDALETGEVPVPEGAARLHRPVPRLGEGAAAADAGATSMIDISDGLAADLGHIAGQSGVGVRVDADWIPREPDVPLAVALRGGDDYELCFTAPDPMQVGDAFLSRRLSPPTRIGEIVAARSEASAPSDLVLVVEGQSTPWPTGSWEHELD